MNQNVPVDQQSIDEIETELDMSNCCGCPIVVGRCSGCWEGGVTVREEQEYQEEERKQRSAND